MLLRGTKLAPIEPLSVVGSCKLFDESLDFQRDNDPGPVVSQPQSNEVLEHFCEEYGFKSNSKLTPGQRHELLQMLYDYRAVFCTHPFSIGKVSLSTDGTRANIE